MAVVCGALGPSKWEAEGSIRPGFGSLCASVAVVAVSRCRRWWSYRSIQAPPASILLDGAADLPLGNWWWMHGVGGLTAWVVALFVVVIVRSMEERGPPASLKAQQRTYVAFSSSRLYRAMLIDLDGSPPWGLPRCGLHYQYNKGLFGT